METVRDKKTQSPPAIVAPTRDRRLELEQIGEELEFFYVLGILIESDSTQDREPANRHNGRDTALPFLIFRDTRLN